jgi:hypothetical protein
MTRMSFLLPVLLAGCSPLLEAEFNEVKIERPDVQVSPATTTNAPVTFSFAFDSSKVGANSNPGSQSMMKAVKLKSLSLTAKSEVTDLSFIRTLHVLAYVPLLKSLTQSSNMVEIANYERRTNETIGNVFSVPLPEPVDLLPLLRPSLTDKRNIDVVVNIGGSLPTKTWTTDVALTLSVEIKQ